MIDPQNGGKRKLMVAVSCGMRLFATNENADFNVSAMCGRIHLEAVSDLFGTGIRGGDYRQIGSTD